jgi:pre-mRNA-splicing factor ATP-dependent RNA helicase DHX15/PRP43
VYLKEIAPVYYDLESFEHGEVKKSLARAAEKKRRKEAMKAGR